MISANVGIGSQGYINNGVTPVFAGTFTQSGGTSTTQDLQLGDGYNQTDCKATYNLCGGLLQTPQIEVGGANPLSDITFKFTGGTLQAVSGGNGSYNSAPITVGTAASNVATVDANGQTYLLNNSGGGWSFNGSGKLRVIDSAGGGMVVLGGNDGNGDPINNTYSGGTQVLSGTLQVLNSTALPSAGLLTVGGPGQSISAVFDLNGQQVTTQGLVTASSWPFSTSPRPASTC